MPGPKITRIEKPSGSADADERNELVMVSTSRDLGGCEPEEWILTTAAAGAVNSKWTLVVPELFGIVLLDVAELTPGAVWVPHIIDTATGCRQGLDAEIARPRRHEVLTRRPPGARP